MDQYVGIFKKIPGLLLGNICTHKNAIIYFKLLILNRTFCIFFCFAWGNCVNQHDKITQRLQT